MPNVGKWRRWALLACSYAVLFWLGKASGTWMVRGLGFDPSSATSLVGKEALWTGLVAYAVLLAIPFVPGVEISLALFAMFGSRAAIPIYLTTLAALSTSYLVGRTIPIRVVSKAFRTIGLHRAGHLVQRLEPLDANARLSVLIETAPPRYVPFLIRHRYVALAVALNLPGNTILGGGGGIALLCGLSGLFTFRGFLLAICLAVLPVPLAAVLGAKWF